MALILACLGQAIPASAESIQWNTTYSGGICPIDYAGAPNCTAPGIVNPSMRVAYSMSVTRTDTGQPVACGATVPVGTPLRFAFTPHVSEDIYWFATGQFFDSPYGDWIAAAANPGKSTICAPKNWYTDYSEQGNSYHLYASLSIAPPTQALSVSGAGCNTTSGTTADCMPSQAGNIAARFSFDQTQGYFYMGEQQTSYPETGQCTPASYAFDAPGSIASYDGSGHWSNAGAYTLTVPAQSIQCPITVSDGCSAASASAAGAATPADKPFYWLDTAPKVGGYSQNAAVTGDVTQVLDTDTTSVTALMYCRVGRYGAVMNQTQFWVLDKNSAPVFSSDTVACKQSTPHYFTSPTGCNTGTCYESTYEIPLPASGAPYSIHTVGNGANGYAADNYIFDAYLGVTEHKSSVTTAGSSGSSASSCTPPSTPTVAAISTSSCTAGTPFEISFSATDPSGNRVRYGIDWNGDGTIDQLVPPTGYVASGTKLTASRTFTTGGTKSIKVVAINELGISSRAATLPVTCGAASATSVMTGNDDAEGNYDGGAGGTGGSVSPDLSIRATPSLVHPGDVVKVSWSATHVSSCTVTGSNKDTWDTLTSIPGGNDTSPIREATTFLLRCLDTHGTTLAKSVTVNILPNWQEQ
jgi:hypothetical protein